jgi:phenylalanyl-tRNA synthetase beta subunit
VGVLQLKKKKGVTSEGVLREALDAVSKKIGQPLLTSPLEVGAHGAVTEIDVTSLVSVLGKAGGLRDLHFVPLSKEKKYKPFSSYPFITRDIAFFTPLSVDEAKARAVLFDTVRLCGGDILVKGPDLFDMFEKDGKRSYGFRFIFQSFTRTLSDSEIVGVMEKVYGAVKEKGWEPR